MTGQTSIEFIEKLDDVIESILAYDADLIKHTLLHLGNVAEKISFGNNIFISQNYSAQRIKKLAFGQQSRINVSISKNNAIDFVKKQYKGNWEQLKHHKDLKSFSESNRTDNTFDLTNPIDQKLAKILDNKLQSKLRYMELRRITGPDFQLGTIRTKFCLLSNDDDGVKMDHLCFTYGGAVLLFEDQIDQLNLIEVQKQIVKKMMAEQNGLSSKNIKAIQTKIKDVSMITKFVRE